MDGGILSQKTSYQKLKPSIGPRAKFDTTILIGHLKDDQLYSPKSAASTMFDPNLEGHKFRLMKSRLYAFSSSHRIRECGEGSVDGMPAWYGRTWKGILGHYELTRGILALEILSILTQGLKNKQQAAKEVVLQSPTPMAGPNRNVPQRVSVREMGTNIISMAIMEALMRFTLLRNVIATKATATVGLAVFGVVFLGAAVNTVLLEPQVYRVLRNDGLRAAVHLLSERPPQTKDEIYQSAWVSYLNKAHDQAERKALQLLGDENSSQKLKGDCYYLMGQIRTALGEFTEALGYYSEAHSIYTGLQIPANQFLSALGLAKTNTLLGHFDEARAMLEATQAFHDQSNGNGNLLYYYNTQVKLAILSGEFETGLEPAAKAAELAYASNNRSALVDAYCNLGLIYAAMGEMENAASFTTKAEMIIVDLSSKEQYIYSLINWVVIRRCWGMTPSAEIQAIEDWVSTYDDEILQVFLSIGLGLECRDGSEVTAHPDKEVITMPIGTWHGPPPPANLEEEKDR
jgi:tetratricopeptide (TPR) repeat protein